MSEICKGTGKAKFSTKYIFKTGNKIVHGSMTNDLEIPKKKKSKIPTKEMNMPSEQSEL